MRPSDILPGSAVVELVQDRLYADLSQFLVDGRYPQKMLSTHKDAQQRLFYKADRKNSKGQRLFVDVTGANCVLDKDEARKVSLLVLPMLETTSGTRTQDDESLEEWILEVLEVSAMVSEG